MYALMTAETGNVLDWYDSEAEVLAAVRTIAEVEPEAVGGLVAIEFGDNGRPTRKIPLPVT